MARNGMIEVEGTVEKLQGGGFYAVSVEGTTRMVQAKLSGKLRQYRIRVLPGDKVRLEVSEADISKGFIVYRIG
jgi:translation initiation factor IF-1